MPAVIPVTNSVVCANEHSIFNYFGWPSVTRLPDGTLAAVASGFRLDHICPFGKGIICYSRDEGATWTAPAVIIDTPLDDRDCGISVIGENRVMVTSFNNTVCFQRERLENKGADNPYAALIDGYLKSFDAEKAESRFLGSTYVVSRDSGYTFGPVKLSPVTSIHGPCVRGSEVLYVGRDYRGRTQGERLFCCVLDENDDFQILSEIAQIDAPGSSALGCEPHAAVMPDGSIVVCIRVQSPDIFTLYQCESYDGGRSFTVPHRIGPDGGAPGHLLVHSSGVLICTFGYRLEPFGQRAMFSRDFGKTWSADYILRGDGPSKDLGYPCTVELLDGSLLSVYYQRPSRHESAVIMQSVWRLPEEI